MRKTLLLAAVFAAIAMAANADGTQNFYDARGHKTGSATTIGNTTTFYDADGNRTGSATRSPSGVTTFYDKLGRRETSTTALLGLGRLQ